MSIEDAENWMAHIQTGSIEVFDSFYEIYRPFVYSQSLRLTGNQAEAEDLCQDVFVEVLKTAEKFDPSRGSVKAWLTVKTRSRFLDRKRKTRRALTHLNQMKVISRNWEKGSDEALLKKVDHDELLTALETLPDSQKMAVFHKYFKEKTQKEIAHSMDKPLGTVKSLIRYGTINLRKTLVARGFND